MKRIRSGLRRAIQQAAGVAEFGRVGPAIKFSWNGKCSPGTSVIFNLPAELPPL
jgi:hypothetical protein